MRMRLSVLAILLLVVAPPASAGSFTITTTPDRDAALAKQLDEPTVFTVKGQPAKTPQQYIQDLVNQHLDGLKEHQAVEQARAKAREKTPR